MVDGGMSMTTETKPGYVILTGSKNNAGDFLIKYRAKNLFGWLRPDRQIIDMDGWKPFTDEALATVNQSKALILMGGPALQEKMRPRVYGLVDDLDRIKVPVVTMGIGWYSHKGRWEDTHHYPMNKLSQDLLAKIAQSGLTSSVRDYHTLNALNEMGYSNYSMTGCPALYCRDHLEKPLVVPAEIRKIGFSLGVSMKSSPRMFRQMQDAVLKVREVFPKAVTEVVFHHAVGQKYLETHGAASDLHQAQERFLAWLEAEKIPYVDISGSAENLMEYYSGCDLHIGYRVHAHIFMSSVAKPSVLLSEDGRGIALKEVLSGVSLESYSSCAKNKVVTALHKASIPFDDYVPALGMISDLEHQLKYETSRGVRFGQVKDNIRRHFPQMESFIKALP